ncbi:MAG: hypothetical protein ACM3JG_02105 [Thiohalocapsa sp.]
MARVLQAAAKVNSMRDLINDWKRWNRSERVLAIGMTLLLAILPLALLLAGKAGV